MSEQSIVDFVVSRVEDWENDMVEFFGLWNEWASSYRMKYQDGERRPAGISKNVVAETPRATNTLATTMTRMQTSSDPPFELRAKSGSKIGEEQIFYMEARLKENLIATEFKRYLLKGNRSMCLFGTQPYENVFVRLPYNFPQAVFEGTALRPLSLLQSAFNSSVYDMSESDFFCPVVEIENSMLRNLSVSGEGVWDREKIEKAIKEKLHDGAGDYAQSSIEQRRQKSGYSERQKRQLHKLALYSGRFPDEIIDQPEFAQMWNSFNRTDDPRFCDIVCGILDGKYIVRFHPAPYNTWHYTYSIGHFIEFELEPLGHGVGSLGGGLQKDLNRLMRYVNDVAKFSLFNMFLAGRGSGLKTNYMNIFPWSAIPVDDVNQIKELRPQIEGILNGLKLTEFTREDFRAVTHATTTLQAILTGATATESSLAQGEALRAISVATEINSDSVVRPYFNTAIRNMIDQNPYDTNLVDVLVEPKLTTDRDYKPEHSKKLIEIATFLTSIRSVTPIDFNMMPILEYLVRSVGINPAEIKKPKSQVDRSLEILRRLSQSGTNYTDVANELKGEQASAGVFSGGIETPPKEVPTSPLPELVS